LSTAFPGPSIIGAAVIPGWSCCLSARKPLRRFGSPAQAERIRTLEDLAEQTLIESEVKQVRWPAWFATNGVMAPEMRGPRFDRSFLSISAAADGLGVALESTRLAERELASGRLVRPLPQARDVVHIAHWLAFPRSERYRHELLDFLGWMGGELGVQLDPLATSGPA